MKNFYLYIFPLLLLFTRENTKTLVAQDKIAPGISHTGISDSPGKIFSGTASIVINAQSYGFLPSATASINTVALQRISAEINRLKGGVKLIINKGIYRVGKEAMSGASGKGYAFRGESMLKLTGCNKPVIIEGNGATLKLADGMHFGAFESRTGKVHNAPPGGFYQHDYTAYPQIIIEATDNESITIQNIILDGNSQNLKLGGYWGDVGIQLAADGIDGSDNNELIVDRVTSKYFARDGIVIINSIKDAVVKKVSLLNCIFDGNGRQGLSWVGGNHLYALNCKFINTGKTINKFTKLPVSSAPGAGIDMEQEVAPISNGLFKNCYFDNNAGAGVLSVGDVSSITFEGGKIIGATSWSIYGSGPKMIFNKTTIVGSPVNLRTGTGPNDIDNTHFNGCFITLDSTLSPTKKVYGRYVMDFGGGAGGFFTNCVIDSKNRGTVYGGLGCVFTNCTFKQGATAPEYNGYPFFSGNFYGTNRWEKFPYDYKYKLEDLDGLAKSKFYGPFFVNGVEVTGKIAN